MSESEARPVLPSGEAVAAGLLRSLQEQLRRAGAVLEELARMTPADSSAQDRAVVEELRERVRSLEDDRVSIADRLVEAENHGSRVMSLYVVTYQLHASLDPREVEETIVEITTDLLGAESFVLLLREEVSGHIRVEQRRGLELSANPTQFAEPLYLGGHFHADQALASGQLFVGEDIDSETLAAIPLSVQGQVIGALLIFRLLSHRRRPLSEDRELLDLVAAHAASALVAARAFQVVTRKLRTLEGLMSLLGGDDAASGPEGPA